MRGATAALMSEAAKLPFSAADRDRACEKCHGWTKYSRLERFRTLRKTRVLMSGQRECECVSRHLRRGLARSGVAVGGDGEAVRNTHAFLPPTSETSFSPRSANHRTNSCVSGMRPDSTATLPAARPRSRQRCHERSAPGTVPSAAPAPPRFPSPRETGRCGRVSPSRSDHTPQWRRAR